MSKTGDIQIGGIWYDGFSIERKTFGGYFSQKEVKEELKKRGIKYNTSQAYTIYQGHWAIYVESRYSEMFSDWVFGDLWEMPEKPVENETYLNQKKQQ